MTVDALKTAIAKKTPGVYLLCGEEEYLKRYYLGEFRKAFVGDESLAAFNHIRVESEKPELGALLSAVETPPVFNDTKLVECHLFDFGALREKEWDTLRDLFAGVAASPDTALVFYVETEHLDLGAYPKKPSKMYTELNKIANITVFERSSDVALSSWLSRHFAKEKITASPGFLREMIARCGHDMEVLSQETEKIAYYLHAHGMTEATVPVLSFVSPANIESDAFALSNAVLDGNGADAFRALADMKRHRVEPSVLLGTVSRIYADLLTVSLLSSAGASKAEIAAKTKMHEYKVGLYLRAAEKKSPAELRKTLDACRRADVQSKSGGSTGYAVIEQLIAAETRQGGKNA